jgi:hypothetical protein
MAKPFFLDLPYSESAALLRAGIHDEKQLWQSVETDGVAKLAAATGLDIQRLLEILAAAQPADPERESLLRRRWPEALLAALALLVAFSWLQARSARQVVVAAPGGLPALHLVQGTDIAVRRGPKRAGTFASESEVVGRLTVETVAAGEALREEQVGPSPANPLPGRRVVSLAVRAEALGAVARGSRIDLLLSPRRAQADSAPAVVRDVLVLAVQREAPSSLLVAVRERDLPELGRFLGTSEVLVVQ